MCQLLYSNTVSGGEFPHTFEYEINIRIRAVNEAKQSLLCQFRFNLVSIDPSVVVSPDKLHRPQCVSNFFAEVVNSVGQLAVQKTRRIFDLAPCESLMQFDHEGHHDFDRVLQSVCLCWKTSSLQNVFTLPCEEILRVFNLGVLRIYCLLNKAGLLSTLLCNHPGALSERVFERLFVSTVGLTVDRFHYRHVPPRSTYGENTGQQSLKIVDEVAPTIAASFAFDRSSVSENYWAENRYADDKRDQNQQSPFVKIGHHFPLKPHDTDKKSHFSRRLESYVEEVAA